MRISIEQLKSFILDAGLVKKEQFAQALKKAKQENKRIEHVLVNENLISQEDLARLKAYILGIPFVNLEKEQVSPEILRIIPEPIAREHNIVAFNKKNKNLEVAMLDIEDLESIEFIERKTGLKILPRLTTTQSIKHVLSLYQKNLQAEFCQIIEDEVKEIKPLYIEEIEKSQEVPMFRIIETLLKHAVLQNASDIHIEPSEKQVLIRYRINGIICDVMSLPLATKQGIVHRIKSLSNLKLDSHLPQDGSFKIDNHYFRASFIPVFNGEKVVIRVLSEKSKTHNLEELGLREQALERLEKALKKNKGMILVTGQGRTTTIYTIMEMLNTPEKSISTIEQPIEYRLARVNQTQVNPNIGLTFASGLRTLLRQDPDIIMLSDIKDKETAGLAINAALNNHLVISGLEADSAEEAITRLINMGVESFLLSAGLNLVLNQRLVRRLDNKEKYRLKAKEIKQISKYSKDKDFYQAKTYKGRIGIFEVMEISDSIRQLIQTNPKEIQKQAQKEQMELMIEDGINKAKQGIIDIKEVLRINT